MFTKNSDTETDQLGGGVTRKVLSHSEGLMIVEVAFEAGGVGADHSHPHEQITYVVSGKAAYHEAGKPEVIMTAGDSYYVTPNAVHGMKALEKTLVLDVFTPAREDFLKK
ncbi:MAG: cupin domain-containing protein [Fusobacteriaceae bacterium]|jgi:quercetin dioxygenase-like cupin family protein|nr:cupin domain-containing protein [Fusobacteriaceae bacterium]